MLQDRSQAYATIYFRSIRKRDEHFRGLAELGLKAEIYFQYGWERLSLSAHKSLAEIVRGELPGCAVHLPFHDLIPGDADPAGEKIGQMLRSLEAAALYQPDHLVGHARYDPRVHSAAGPGAFHVPKNDSLTGPMHVPSSAFLNHSAAFWLAVMDASPAKLFLENTDEHSPLPILSVLSLLTSRAAMCLDIGHWHHYGMGGHWDNLDTWLMMCGDRVGHLHIHDNDGGGDQHLGLGLGTLDLPKVWELLSIHVDSPSITLENHRLEGLLTSAMYLERHPLV